jgi:hypothetical protein
MRIGFQRISTRKFNMLTMFSWSWPVNGPCQCNQSVTPRSLLTYKRTASARGGILAGSYETNRACLHCCTCNSCGTATSSTSSMNSKVLGHQGTATWLHTPCSRKQRVHSRNQVLPRLQAEPASSNSSSSSRSPVLILPGFLSNNTTSETSQYRELADNLLQLGHPAAGGLPCRGTGQTSACMHTHHHMSTTGQSTSCNASAHSWLLPTQLPSECTVQTMHSDYRQPVQSARTHAR